MGPVTLKATTIQRLILTMVINSWNGNMSVIRKAVKLLDVVELTDLEKQQINWRTQGLDFKWDDPKREWTLTFGDPDSITLLKEKLKSQTFDLSNGREMLSIYEQLGIEINNS